jgi:hypothetical protein
MGRLIEIEPSQELPSSLTLSVGDLLRLWATGCRVELGADVVEVLGPFMTSVIGIDGSVLSPMGAPNVIMLLARNSGRAEIDVITGDPWGATQTARLEVLVVSQAAE